MTETLMFNRPTWVVLVQTGNPHITHTEYAHSLSGVRDMIDYYSEGRLLIFGEGYNSLD